MASSDVEICNIALQMLGAKPITSLTEASERASLANQLYANARDETLRAHTWNFAQVRKALAPETDTPVFGYTYQYQLPTDPYCLRVNETDPADAIYVIEGRKLITSEPALKIRYTRRVTDVAQFDELFTAALAAKLASQMAYPITKKESLAELAEKKFLSKISEARTIDSQEGSTQIADVTVLTDVRQAGFRDWTRNNRVI